MGEAGTLERALRLGLCTVWLLSRRYSGAQRRGPQWRCLARSLLRLLGGAIAGGVFALTAHAATGLMEWPAEGDSGPVTLFYPAAGEPRTWTRGPARLSVVLDAPPLRGNGLLIAISHGSPASPWVYADLAQALVQAGFTVVMPEHRHDNSRDDSEPGPPSWRRRPQEVSVAIDRVRADARLAAHLNFERIGMYGMSAGGHTALTLAGGRWSPSRLRDHCQANIREDFAGCAGPTTQLGGSWLDGIKIAAVQAINNHKFDDPAWYQHRDPRIVAIVAGVPFAVDFDPQSLRNPAAALALITARKDVWLNPRFHSDAVLKACLPRCEHLLDLAEGGHGALLSPLPPLGSGIVSQLVGDPPGFDRAAQVPRIHDAIVRFFVRRLGSLP